MKSWNEVFKNIKPEKINENLFDLINYEWFLISAGTPESFNTMTASWGTMGILWNKPIAICFIRPSRYTYNFMENSDVYTLSFLGTQNKAFHKVCGSKSGRDIDKIKETGLLPVLTENKSVSYEQARLVFECRKIYFDDLKPELFLQKNIDKEIYESKDYHRMYFGEILNVYTK
jgi:flavin reductase (DIM6/NTAB) family NADH-FMN oxidoreductase RutF